MILYPHGDHDNHDSSGVLVYVMHLDPKSMIF